jgi:putative ABC transport system ATP-binding protein
MPTTRIDGERREDGGMAENDFILLEEVTKSYLLGEVTVDALRGLSGDIPAGELVVLLGPSGCGKTTTLDLLGGLDKPTSGRIIVNGEDITHFSGPDLNKYRRNMVGFIFQFFNLIPTLTAAENVEFALALGERGNLHRRAVDLLNLVGLGDRVDHFPSQLSGGEQQRVAAARAIANNPPILLCDEPTGNLDLDSGQQVLSVIRALNRQEGATVVLVTHNVAIAPMADRVVYLHDGAVDRIETNPNPVDVSELSW